MSAPGGARTHPGTVDRRPEVSDEDSRAALAWIQAARAAAIDRFPYLDTALSAMIPVAVPGLGTVATDTRWRFYYDPLRTLEQARDDRTQELVADWVHEVGHQLRDHGTRWQELAESDELHHVFNVAGDALINHDLEALGLPVDGLVTFEQLPYSVNPAMTTEGIYRELLPRGAGRRGGPGRAGPAAHDCGSGAGGPARPWELPVGSEESVGSQESDAADGSVGRARGELIREAAAEQIREYERSCASGAVPGGLSRWADHIQPTPVDWRKELRAVVGRVLGVAAGRRDYSWSRRSRRRVPGYLMPGMVTAEPPQAAVVVDTSGSMEPDDLAQCLGDIAELTRSTGGIGLQVLPCDVRPGPVTVVRRRDRIPQIELSGGGGTDMTAGIAAAASLRPRPDVIITLTDGYTAWPEDPPEAAPRARYVAVVLNHPEEAVLDAVPDWIRVIERGAGND